MSCSDDVLSFKNTLFSLNKQVRNKTGNFHFLFQILDIKFASLPKILITF